MQLYDFLSKDEEDAIRAIEEALLRKTAESRKRAVEKLAKLLTVSYYVGAEKAIKEVGADVRITSLEIRALEKLIEQDVAPAIKEMYEFLERDVKSVIEEGIREGLTYDEISTRLKERLRTTFGEEIHFDRRGKLREEIYVDRRGRLRVRQVEITRTKTLKLDDYADLLARTNVKKAYALGHREGYVTAGLRKWRYRSVADERTRPHHLALHGRVFEVGTVEEELALRVMSEPNCRCRPSPYFDDPKLDTPQEVFEQEKKKWAKQTFNEWKLDRNIAFVARANPQSKKELFELKKELAKRFSTKDYQALGYALSMSSEEMAEDVLNTLYENFSYSYKDKQFSFVHIYDKHMVKEKFSLLDVLRIREEGIPLGLWRGSLHKVSELQDGRLFRVAISPKTLKINTAHVTSERYLEKIKREAKRVDYDYSAG